MISVLRYLDFTIVGSSLIYFYIFSGDGNVLQTVWICACICVCITYLDTYLTLSLGTVELFLGQLLQSWMREIWSFNLLHLFLFSIDDDCSVPWCYVATILTFLEAWGAVIDMFKDSDKKDSELAIDLQYLLLQLLLICFALLAEFLIWFDCNLTYIYLYNECVVLSFTLRKRVAKCCYFCY